MPDTPTSEELENRLIALAMGILGRRGGRAKSAKKTKAVRENGKKGGAPKGNTNRWGKSSPRMLNPAPSRMAQYQRDHRARVAAAKAKTTE
jgi:hypothetical protein